MKHKHYSLLRAALLCSVLVGSQARGQISGYIYRDFNGSGTRTTTSPNNETPVAGIIVNAYGAHDVLLASVTSTAPLTNTANYSFTAAQVPSGTAVRLEFILPNTGYNGNSLYDHVSALGTGNGSNVQFVTAGAGATNVDFGINAPADYVSTTNPTFISGVYSTGNPLSGGASGTGPAIFFGSYNATGTITPSSIAAAGCGSVFGLANSPRAGITFASALVKRHVGMGPGGPSGSPSPVNAPGSIYRLNTVSSTSTFFFSLDALGFDTHDHTAAATLNVRPNNGTGGRGLPTGTGNNTDADTYNQPGKTGLGGLDLSDDGRYLYAVNLYDKKLYRIDLQNAASPVTPTAAQVTAINIPNPNPGGTLANGGAWRPFAVKVYRGKVYVGGVLSGQAGNGSGNTIATTTAQLDSMRGYIYEYDIAAGSFEAVPSLQFPLRYAKGVDGDNTNETWRPWQDSPYPGTGYNGNANSSNNVDPEPMISDIEFDGTNGVIIGMRDRFGDQSGNGMDNPGGTEIYPIAFGDILRAQLNSDGSMTLESNGSCNGVASGGPDNDGIGSITTTGIGNGQGPGGGEFYYMDNVHDNHNNTCLGGLAQLPGDDNVIATFMDPTYNFTTSGTRKMNRTNGSNPSGCQMTSILGKANGMGDIELVASLAPVQVGNRVWSDANGNGVQDAGESGLASVSLQLFADFNNDGTADGSALATTSTDASGVWSFNDDNVTDGDPGTGGNQAGLKINATYLVRVNTTQWNSGLGTGTLSGYRLTDKGISGAGAPGLSDNDAELAAGSNIPQLSFTTGDYGSSNYDLDFGFKNLGGIGDKAWRDDNSNGVQDSGEPGLSGVAVELYNNGGHRIAGTVTDAYGNYFFDNLPLASYSVKVHIPANYALTVTGSGTNATDNDFSLTGSGTIVATSGTITLTAGAGQVNTDIDAGFRYNSNTDPASIGNLVWLDRNNNNVYNAGTDLPLAGVTVTLKTNTGTLVTATKTDATGVYSFVDVAPGNYMISITPPHGTVLVTTNQGANGGSTLGTPGESDVDNDVAAGGNTAVFTVAAGQQIINIDAGLKQHAAGNSSVGNLVWNDLDHDGIQDVNEPGIPGITVTLKNAGPDMTAGNGDDQTIGTAVTDVYGVYDFNDLAAGNGYYVVFNTTGYTVSPAFAGTSAEADNNANASGTTAVFALRPGIYNGTIDAGMYKTGTYAVIGDLVWDDQDGDGQQTVGEPGVGGVTVILYNNGGTAIATTVTNEKGFYKFTEVTSGTYTVGFSNLPKGYSFTRRELTPAANGSDVYSSGHSGSITVTAGNSYPDVDAGIRQGVPVGNASIGDLVWNDLNNNGVQDAGELGIPDVTVTLKDEAGTVIAATVTNILGNYQFTSVVPGSYFVAFSGLPSGGTVSTKNAGSDRHKDSDGGTLTGGVSETNVFTIVTGEDNLSVDLGVYYNAASGKGNLGNYAWNDANNNGIQDAAEPGVAGVTVTLLTSSGAVYDNNGSASGVQPYVTTTDRDGQYLFSAIPAGSYKVQFSNLPAGFTGFTTPSGTNTANGSDADRINGVSTNAVALAAGATDNTLDAGLTGTRAAFGDYVFEDLDGDGVQDATEPGIAGATVNLYFDTDNNGSISGTESTTPVATAITDGDGRYQFGNLVAGNYSAGFADAGSNTLPGYLGITAQHVGGAGAGNNSKADPVTGRTDVLALAAGALIANADAGLRSSGLAVVGDKIFIDDNINGLENTAEIGFPGALITLYDVATGNPTGAVIADGGGNYTMRGVKPGTYYAKFEINLPNFNTGANPSFTLKVNGGSTPNPGTGITDNFIVNRGDRVLTIDAGISNLTQSVVLPVRLLSFDATLGSDRKAHLGWHMADEQGVKNYRVEWSTNGADFSGIATVAYDPSQKGDYTAIHNTPVAGINYYRLRIGETNGMTTYSEVRTIRLEQGTVVSVYPNPAAENLHVVLSEEWKNKAVTLRLLNKLGQVAATQTTTDGRATLDVRTLPAGSYVLQISSASGNAEAYHVLVAH